MTDKNKQIEVLLYGDPYKFACETLGVSNMKHNKYSEVFTVTKEEVFEYTATHGIPPSGPAIYDGFYYFKEEGEWHTYFKERGHVFDKKTFSDEERAEKYIVGTLLKLRMTGLF